MDNIKINAGSSIPTPTSESETLNFDMLNFGDIEMVCLKKSSSLSSKKLKTMMNGKTHLIVVDTIESAGGIDDNIVSAAEKEQLEQKPCAVLSPFKSIMPQIISPLGNVDICDNGLGSGLEICKSPGIDGGGQFTWEPDIETFQKNYGVDSNVVNDMKNWGVREAQTRNAGYITMAGVKNKKMDTTITRNRIYELNTGTGKYGGGGSCVFGYQFLGGEESGEGTGKETALAPHLLLSLSEKHDTTKEMKISVNPKQGMFARVGDDVGQGSLGKPQTTMLPPNCKNYENMWNCMFIYPLYAGFVISSTSTRQLSQENDNSVVISYDDAKPPFNNVGFINVSMSNEIISYVNKHKEEAIEWFPALLTESTNRQNVGIAVKRSDERIKMSNRPQLEWEKSFGKFFYCPLYFQRHIKFTLYFIGEPDPSVATGDEDQGDTPSGGDTSQPGVNRSTKYWFYPLITTDMTTDKQGESWSAGVRYGTIVGQQGTTSGGNNLYYGEMVTASSVCRYSETNETIYKAVFEFKTNSNESPRYPLEIHGAVCVTHKDGPSITIENGNGSFSQNYETKNQYRSFVDIESEDNIPIEPPNGDESDVKNYDFIKYATELNVNVSFGGVTGNLDLDEYAIEGLLENPKLEQNMGELCLKVKDTDGIIDTKNIFTGYGMEIKKTDSESNHTVSINLLGVQKKLEDMKLIAAPFWDGDRLETIAFYFQEYCNVQLKMVDYTVENIDDAKLPTVKYGPTGTWTSNSSSIVVDTITNHPDFRVPRSSNYRKPAIDFKTGTRCIDALNQLAEKTSCVFLVQPDGIGYFFELNEMGIPYYVEKQTNIVEFDASDIISINVSPYIENKYNTFATMGFLQKINKKSGTIEMQSVNPQLIYTPYKSLKNNFPWARVNVYVENGYMTLSELTEVHTNNVKFGVSEIYQGTIQVKGNNKVTHIYQRIKVCGVDFFVSSIDHRIDLSTKTWTSNYGLSLYEQATPPSQQK